MVVGAKALAAGDPVKIFWPTGGEYEEGQRKGMLYDAEIVAVQSDGTFSVYYSTDGTHHRCW